MSGATGPTERACQRTRSGRAIPAQRSVPSPGSNSHHSDDGQARDAGHHDSIAFGCIHCLLPNCCQLLGHCYAGEIAGPGADSIRHAATGLALCVRPLIVTLIRKMMMRFGSFRALSYDQKLFPHFSEAGAAIFTIEHV